MVTLKLFYFSILHCTLCFDFLQFRTEFNTYLQTNILSVGLHSKANEFFKYNNPVEKNKAACDICSLIANTTITLRKSERSKVEIRKFGGDMCTLFAPYNVLECNRYIDNLINAGLYIIDKKLDLTPESICRIRLQEQNCFSKSENLWQIELPEGNSKPLIDVNDETQNKIMQITDIHYDPLYKEGSAAVCKDVMCCESISGEPNISAEAAGYWGDYHICDMPWYSIEDLMQQVKQHNVDWVYFTGDMITHQIGIISISRNTEIIKKISKKLKDTFQDVPVYPILGNHEPHLVNSFSPENITAKDLSTQWLYDAIADEWGYWLDEDAKAMIRRGGFYTVHIKPGLRLIALNSNVCYINNVWLLYEETDTYNQLQWLSDTLLNAEKNNEAVHIISHIPVGQSSCLKQWNRQYNRIIERFHNIITGQFNGHTHKEGFKIFYDSKDSDKVINVAFNGGSFTTFVGNNPNYKIYHTEGGHYRIEDYEVWMYDLSEANKGNTQPKWFQLYSFKDAFGIENSNQEGYHNLVKKLASNRTMLETYRRFRARKGTAVSRECNLPCWEEVFCEITQIDYEESVQCKWFQKDKFQ